MSGDQLESVKDAPPVRFGEVVASRATTVTGLVGAADVIGDIDLSATGVRTDVAGTPNAIDAARAITQTGAA